MFVRIIKGRQKEYGVIIRGYRDKDGKVRHRTVKNLGAITAKNKEAILELGRRLISQSQGHEIVTTGKEIKELSRQNWGGPAIIEKLWERFNLDAILSKQVEALKLMLTGRLLDPSSKLATYTGRCEYVNFTQVKLQELYRALDLLDKSKEKLQAHIFNKQKLYGKLDVIFFDVTTLYFESQKVDTLRNFGFSKDCKFNEVQIVLSLVINSEGRPLTYEVFSGSTYEGNTLLLNLQKLKAKYNIDKVIIVADRGIGSKANLNVIKEAGFNYIIGARLRSASKVVKAEAIDSEGYNSFPCSQNSEDLHKYKIIKNQDSSWVVLWSAKRAAKDKQDRQRLVERAQEMLADNKVQDKRGAKKYIRGSKTAYCLDAIKIEQDAQFDGFYALSFSDESMSPQDIAGAYHGLWKIEESFRTIKDFFEVRPMFHWTPKRISGHIMLNFIALVLENDLLLKLKTKVENIAHFSIREAIANMQFSILQIGNNQFLSYSSLNALQKTILKSLAINLPLNSTANLVVKT